MDDVEGDRFRLRLARAGRRYRHCHSLPHIEPVRRHIVVLFKGCLKLNV
jgi:hypothetical protein